jgi:hypothetical protein
LLPNKNPRLTHLRFKRATHTSWSWYQLLNSCLARTLPLKGKYITTRKLDK